MTVAMLVKVFDGLVLAADSATTLTLAPQLAASHGSHQVYNNANKIFHLHRGLPIGAVTWGMGNVGSASIATLAKDIRARFMGQDVARPDWKLDPDTYTIEEVAKRLANFVFDELDAKKDVTPDNPLGILVAGYSGQQHESQAWKIVGDTQAVVPVPVLEADETRAGWFAYAQGYVVARLINGYDPRVMQTVSKHADAKTLAAIQQDLAALPLEDLSAVPAMPIMDAIKLAEFMVDTSIGYVRYRLGTDTVGGVGEVACITRHEGFKWVRRKHYYTADLNPHDQGSAP